MLRTGISGLSQVYVAAALLMAVTLPCGLPFMVLPARAATVPAASKLQLIKDNDLAIALDDNGTYDYGHDFSYIACGTGTGPPYASTYAPCSAGQTPTYASWVTLRHDCFFKILQPGQTIMFDIENWSFTPATERANPAKFIKNAVGTAHLNKLKIIVSANFGKATTDIGYLADAAR